MKENQQLKNNTVVTTIMSNLGLYKAFDRLGIQYEKTQVGDKYVYECMQAHQYRLGGEQSGHIIFSKLAKTGDGILTSLKIMEVILETKQSIAKLGSEVIIYPQLLKNVRVTDKRICMQNESLQECMARIGHELGEDGRILVRESGTEPVIRVMVEAKDDATCQKYVDEVIHQMKQLNLVVE